MKFTTQNRNVKPTTRKGRSHVWEKGEQYQAFRRRGTGQARVTGIGSAAGGPTWWTPTGGQNNVNHRDPDPTTQVTVGKDRRRVGLDNHQPGTLRIEPRMVHSPTVGHFGPVAQ